MKDIEVITIGEACLTALCEEEQRALCTALLVRILQLAQSKRNSLEG